MPSLSAPGEFWTGPCRHNTDVGIIVQAGRRDSVRNWQGETGDEVVEGLTRGSGMHGTVPIEGEQRGVGVRGGLDAASPLDLGGDQGCDISAVGHEAALAELCRLPNYVASPANCRSAAVESVVAEST